MQTVKVAICDDEEFFREELEKLVSVYANEGEHELEIHTYPDAASLVTDIVEKGMPYHLLFLDVEMPDMSGMDAAKKLRKEGYKGEICFVTGFQGYALDAFSVSAVGYVCKPAKYVDVKKIIEKALIQIYYQWDVEEAKKRYLEVRTQRETRTVDTWKILYVEKRRNQCVIHLEDGEVVCYDSLKNLFPNLDQSRFCYAHQGYVVNFDKIKEVKKDTICFGEGREIPVSRKHQSELRERHMNKINLLRQERSIRCTSS